MIFLALFKWLSVVAIFEEVLSTSEFQNNVKPTSLIVLNFGAKKLHAQTVTNGTVDSNFTKSHVTQPLPFQNQTRAAFYEDGSSSESKFQKKTMPFRGPQPSKQNAIIGDQRESLTIDNILRQDFALISTRNSSDADDLSAEANETELLETATADFADTTIDADAESDVTADPLVAENQTLINDLSTLAKPENASAEGNFSANVSATSLPDAFSASGNGSNDTTAALEASTSSAIHATETANATSALTTAVPVDSSSVQNANLTELLEKAVHKQFCHFPIPPLDAQPHCTWKSQQGKQLNFWPSHIEASVCVTFVKNLEQCQALCESVPECQSIDYCPPCVEYNCRMFNETVDGPTDLRLSNALSFVDFHEKLECTKESIPFIRSP